MEDICALEYIYPENRHIRISKYHKCGVDDRLFYAATHDEFEILHILDGHGYFIYDDRFFELKPDRLFLIDGRRFHYTNPSNPMTYTRNAVEFSQSDFIHILSLYDQYDLMEPFLHSGSALCCVDLGKEGSQAIDRIFASITGELCRGELGAIPISMNGVIHIIALALREGKKTAASDTPLNITERHVIDIIRYIEENMADFSLDAMADALSLSKYHMCHLFKKATGLTIQNYLLVKRLDRARYLLTSSDLPISEISETLGLSSFSLFSRCFRQTNNMTPREYRASQKKKNS